MARTAEGKTECHQLSNKAMGKIPALKASQYCSSGASTNEGTEMPNTESVALDLSQKVLCRIAAIAPSKIPTNVPAMSACVPRKAETASLGPRTISTTGVPL